jgi:phosphate transport system ATP-binding protein
LKYIVETKKLTITKPGKQILNDISLAFKEHTITAIIGPSGAGKTTFLSALNRLNPANLMMSGKVYFKGIDVYQKNIDVYRLRMLLGMLFARPEIFPLSLAENLFLAPGYNLKISRHSWLEKSERVLRQVHLWEKLKDQLFKRNVRLSVVDSQLFCLARLLLLSPQVLLLDEPTGSFDQTDTFKFEEILDELRSQQTIILVTHNLQQAARVSDYTAFFQAGRLIESGLTQELFTSPQNSQTNDYLAKKLKK